MTIRWISEAERRQDAEIAREQRERDAVEWAFADWVGARAGGGGPFRVPPLSEEMIARLRPLVCEDQP